MQGSPNPNISDQKKQSYTPFLQHPKMDPKKEVSPQNQLWTLKFDGSKSKQGSGSRVELTNSKGETYFVSYRLQFRCTNNVADYEALARGLMFVHQKKLQSLRVLGD